MRTALFLDTWPVVIYQSGICAHWGLEDVGRAVLCTPSYAHNTGTACRGLPALPAMTEASCFFQARNRGI